MHKRYLFTFIFSLFFLTLLLTPVAAVSHNLVISQVQIGNSSNSRLVELFNTSEDPVDITNWCVYHTSASGKTKDKLLCFDSDSATTHLILSGLSYVLIGSNELGVDADFNLDVGLGTSTGGHIYILDESQNEVDRIGWGGATQPETAAFNFNPTNINHVIERNTSLDGSYIDTDDNSLDFMDSSLRETYLTGAISEVDDICSNIDGIQPLMPDGYYRDEDNLCQPVPVDVCPNIDDLQSEVPLGYVVDKSGDCARSDMCLNFYGIQSVVPSGFIESDGSCVVAGLPPQINEIMPNAAGNDNGREFIEIYNPDDTEISLEYYRLLIGFDSSKSYSFPPGSVIGAKSYAVFYNNQIPFTLINTSSAVGLGLADGTKLGLSDAYSSPQDDMAWALINDSWVYTNRPTPGEANLESIAVETPKVQPVISQTSLKPCLANQYRSPETNRCRNNITQPTLVPCGADEYRNPETNRCRSVLGASTSVQPPCEEGKIRNPETNRCKTVVQMTDAPYPVQTSNVDSGVGYTGWWVAAGLGLMATVYAIWEWRSELVRLYNRVVNKLWFVSKS